MREVNFDLPLSFKVFVNDKGTVSFTIIDTSVPAAFYPPFLEALTHKLNQYFPVGNNPWLPFRLPPTDSQFAIHGLPIKAHPEDDTVLGDLLQPSTFNSQSVLISKTCFHHPDPASRLHDPKAFSVVVQVPAEDGKYLTDLSRIPILGGNYVIERAYPSSLSKQCNNCWRFGHVKPHCKNPTVCPLCASPHAKPEHGCPNPISPKVGNLKPVLNCCIASPARCPNCSEDHSAGDRDCTARPIRHPVLLPIPQKRKPPLLPPPDTHLNKPPASFRRLTRMPWSFSQTKQVSLLPLPHPPPRPGGPPGVCYCKGTSSPSAHGSFRIHHQDRSPPTRWGTQPLPRPQRRVGLAQVHVSQLTLST